MGQLIGEKSPNVEDPGRSWYIIPRKYSRNDEIDVQKNEDFERRKAMQDGNKDERKDNVKSDACPEACRCFRCCLRNVRRASHVFSNTAEDRVEDQYHGQVWHIVSEASVLPIRVVHFSPEEPSVRQ